MTLIEHQPPLILAFGPTRLHAGLVSVCLDGVCSLLSLFTHPWLGQRQLSTLSVAAKDTFGLATFNSGISWPHRLTRHLPDPRRPVSHDLRNSSAGSSTHVTDLTLVQITSKRGCANKQLIWRKREFKYRQALPYRPSETLKESRPKIITSYRISFSHLRNVEGEVRLGPDRRSSLANSRDLHEICTLRCSRRNRSEHSPADRVESKRIYRGVNPSLSVSWSKSVALVVIDNHVGGTNHLPELRHHKS